MDTVELPGKLLGRCPRLSIVGSSGTGKSVILEKILRFRHDLIETHRPIDTLIYFYLIKDDQVFESLAGLFSEVRFVQGIDRFGEIMKEYEAKAKETGIAVVLEDLQSFSGDSQSVALAWTAWAHHWPLSLLVHTCQSLYIKSKFSTLLARNLTGLFLTNSKRLKSSLPAFGRDLNPSNPNALLHAFEEATHKKHGRAFPYLFVDLERCEDDSMYLSGLFPGEDLRLIRFSHEKNQTENA